MNSHRPELISLKIDTKANPEIELVQPFGLLDPDMARRPLFEQTIRLVLRDGVGDHILTARLNDARWAFEPSKPPSLVPEVVTRPGFFDPLRTLANLIRRRLGGLRP